MLTTVIGYISGIATAIIIYFIKNYFDNKNIRTKEITDLIDELTRFNIDFNTDISLIEELHSIDLLIVAFKKLYKYGTKLNLLFLNTEKSNIVAKSNLHSKMLLDELIIIKKNGNHVSKSNSIYAFNEIYLVFSAVLTIESNLKLQKVSIVIFDGIINHYMNNDFSHISHIETN